MPYRGSIADERVASPGWYRFDRGHRWPSKHGEAGGSRDGEGEQETIAQREVNLVKHVARGEHVLKVAAGGQRAVDPRPRQSNLPRFVEGSGRARGDLGRPPSMRSALRRAAGRPEACPRGHCRPRTALSRDMSESPARHPTQRVFRCRGDVTTAGTPRGSRSRLDVREPRSREIMRTTHY